MDDDAPETLPLAGHPAQQDTRSVMSLYLAPEIMKVARREAERASAMKMAGNVLRAPPPPRALLAVHHGASHRRTLAERAHWSPLLDLAAHICGRTAAHLGKPTDRPRMQVSRG